MLYKNITNHSISVYQKGTLTKILPDREYLTNDAINIDGLILIDSHTSNTYNPLAEQNKLDTTFVNLTTFNPIVEQLNTNDTYDGNVYNTLVSVSGDLQSQIDSITGGIVTDGNSILSSSVSGSIYRTQQDRNSDFINVKDFGAKGDGVTDDTLAIQNAIDYASLNNKCLNFTHTYKISSPILLVGNNFYLKGIGKIISSSSCVFRVNNDIHDVTIDGLEIISTSSSADAFGVFESLHHTLENINIINNKFSIPNANINGIKIVCETAGKEINYINIQNNKFYNIGRMGIELQNHAADSVYRLKDIKITNNEFSSCGLSLEAGMGVSVSGLGKDLLVSYNTFNDCFVYDIEVVGSSNAIVSNNLGYNHTRGAAAFSVSGVTQTTLIFSNNIFIDCTLTNNFYGIYGGIMEGNYISNASGQSNFKTSNLKITNNVFISNSYNCLFFEESMQNEITYNTFDNSASSGNYSGVRFYNINAHDNIVKNCKFNINLAINGGVPYDSINGAYRNFFEDNFWSTNNTKIENLLSLDVTESITVPDYRSSYTAYVFTGTPSASRNVIFDRVEKIINVKNETSQSISIAHDTGNGVTLSSGKNAILLSTYDDIISFIIS